MDERYHYSGGSVREFTLESPEEIRKNIDDATSGVEGISNKLSELAGCTQIHHVCRTLIRGDGPVTREQLTARRYWEASIDSEYAVRALSLRLRADALYQIYDWGRRTGYRSLAGCVFEIYVHKLAADNKLDLYVSEYDPPTFRQRNEPRPRDRKLTLLKGEAVCGGEANDYASNLTDWRDPKQLTYWFPACDGFPNIDSIAKIESANDKKSVAYFQIIGAKEHD